MLRAKSLYHLIVYSILFIIVLVSTFTFIIISNAHEELQEKNHTLKTDYTNNQKELIKNHVNYIINFIDYYNETNKNKKSEALIQKEVLETLLADNQRAANIIRSLRSIFADEKLASEVVNFSELINSIAGIARSELQMKQIRLQLDFDQNLVLQIHRNELQQVLLNLINNSILALSKVSIEDKCIVITGKYIEEGVEVSVSDNGPGLSDESREHLFELLSASTHQGMGLGLWLCKHIIERHGGKIWYESAPSGGAQFVFTLPSSPLV